MKVATYRKGSGKNIVLLHGWAQDHRSMQPIFDELSQHYCVTAVDLPGAGQSEWHKNIDSFNAVADSILPFLPDNAIYIAWAWGGMVAQSIAGRYPRRVEQLILLNSTPKYIEEKDWPGVGKPGFKAGTAHISTAEDLQDFLLGFYKNEFAADENLPRYQDFLHDIKQHGVAMKPDAFAWGVEIIDKGDVREEFSKIECNIDFIIGDKDQSLPIDWQKVKALNAKVSVHFIKGAQYAPFLTHAKQFFNQLNQLLS